MTKLGQLYREGLTRQLTKGLEKRDNIFVLKFSGLSSPAMNELRKELRRQGARILVVRNSVARRTLKDLAMEGMEPMIEGPVGFIYSDSDAAEVSKTLVKFVKAHEVSQLKGGLLQGGTLSVEDIKRLSNLPSRQVLLSMLLGALQSPMSALSYVLGYNLRALLFALKQLGDKKKS
ncbi:MAG: 50S ribosomal protein L10 [Candidatus Omnitrophota bacterium]